MRIIPPVAWIDRVIEEASGEAYAFDFEPYAVDAINMHRVGLLLSLTSFLTSGSENVEEASLKVDTQEDPLLIRAAPVRTMIKKEDTKTMGQVVEALSSAESLDEAFSLFSTAKYPDSPEVPMLSLVIMQPDLRFKSHVVLTEVDEKVLGYVGSFWLPAQVSYQRVALSEDPVQAFLDGGGVYLSGRVPPFLENIILD